MENEDIENLEEPEVLELQESAEEIPYKNTEEIDNQNEDNISNNNQEPIRQKPNNKFIPKAKGTLNNIKNTFNKNKTKKVPDVSNETEKTSEGIGEKKNELNSNSNINEEEKQPSKLKQAKSQAVAMAKQKAKDKAKEKILLLITKNPWVLLVLIIVVILSVVLLVIIAAEMDDNAYSGSGGGNFSFSGGDSCEYEGDFSTFIGNWEGLTDACEIDSMPGYLGEDVEGNGTVVTVGAGVTNAAMNNAQITALIESSNMEKYFRYNGTHYYFSYGDCLPADIMNDIKHLSTELTYRTPLKNVMDKHGVELLQHQEDALVSFNYNLGPGYSEKLILSYKEGGYEGLWDYMKGFANATIDGVFQRLPGLQKRRKAEFALFVTGDYTDQNLFYSRGIDNYDYYDSENVMAREFDVETRCPSPDDEIEPDKAFEDIYFGNPLDGIYSCTWAFSISNGHYGLDFGAPNGVTILAAEDGIVTDSRYQSSWGYTVKIAHANGEISTRYAHMMQASHLAVGDVIGKGDIVGYVGNTGYSFGNHLHFEIYLGDARVDPANYLNLAEMVSNPESVACQY